MTHTQETQLSQQQTTGLNALIDFATSKDNNDVFILTGSAGTGKTMLLKSFAEELENKRIDYKLLAPTGQAARVLSKSTDRPARTLHSFIYTISEKELNNSTRYEFVPRINILAKPCIVIIDEASMVSDQPANSELFVSNRSVLQDLFAFYRNSPDGTRIVFVGDSFQLPPVNEEEAGALNKKYLQENHSVRATDFSLTEIVRQEKGSYLLNNAMQLRDIISKRLQYLPKLRHKEVYRTELAINTFYKLYDPNDPEHAIFLGWKNLTIDKLNKAIRKKIFHQPNEIFCAGEQVIVGRSYYSNDLYIPSGTFGKVISFDANSYNKAGETLFADAEFEFPLQDGRLLRMKCKFDVDYLLNPNIDNNAERTSKLWAERKRKNKLFRETNNTADDPYLSAVKIKYGYAVTTHKAQGGEWKHVFLYPEFPKDYNRLKWVYTAVTRARKELYSF